MKYQRAFKKLHQVEAALNNLDNERKRLEGIRDNFLRQTEFTCKYCGHTDRIGNMEYLQTYFYDDGMYVEDGGEADCYKCGKSTYFDKQHPLNDLKWYFESIDEYYREVGE